jgi:hypothetical protein
MGFWERYERDQEFDLTMKEFSQFLISLLLSPVDPEIRSEIKADGSLIDD